MKESAAALWSAFHDAEESVASAVALVWVLRAADHARRRSQPCVRRFICFVERSDRGRGGELRKRKAEKTIIRGGLKLGHSHFQGNDQVLTRFPISANQPRVFDFLCNVKKFSKRNDLYHRDEREILYHRLMMSYF